MQFNFSDDVISLFFLKRSERFLCLVTSSVGQVELMLAEGFKYRGVSNKYILSVAAVVPPSFSSSSSTSAVNTNSQQLLSAPPMLVYPYSANGNLKLFLKNLRESHQVSCNSLEIITAFYKSFFLSVKEISLGCLLKISHCSWLLQSFYT